MIGFLREVSPNLDKCELTHVARTKIDVRRAVEQHRAYAKVLEELGVRIEHVAALPDHADGVFVEDAAVLLPEVAIVARSGAKSRLPELASIIQALGQHRPLESIVAPATLDGGDVLRVGRTLYVAESRRTNAEGITQLRDIVRSFGYEVMSVQVRDCLHLKSACTFIPPRYLLANPAWVDGAQFRNLAVIPVDASEPFAANTLTIGGTTLISASFPTTEKRLREAGIATRVVEIAEFEKAEAGVTCLSLLMEPRSAKTAATDSGFAVVETPAALRSAGHVSPAIVHQGIVYVSPLPLVAPTPGRKNRPAVEEQMQHAIEKLWEVLNAAGSSSERVLRTTIHLTDAKHAECIEPIYARAFGQHRPTRAIIVNGALPNGLLVQIEAVAAVSDQSR